MRGGLLEICRHSKALQAHSSPINCRKKWIELRPAGRVSQQHHSSETAAELSDEDHTTCAKPPLLALKIPSNTCRCCANGTAAEIHVPDPGCRSDNAIAIAQAHLVFQARDRLLRFFLGTWNA
jgi:hypothetical protein